MTESRLKPYCLRCYTPVGQHPPTCSVCGFSSPRSLRQRYWTREPWIVRTEVALKIGIAVLLLACVVGILLVARPFGHGRAWTMGWLIGAPFFLAFPAWVTASRLTARGGHFSATWFWVAAFLLAAVGCATFISLSLAIVSVVLALLTLWASASFRRWKGEKILRGQLAEQGE